MKRASILKTKNDSDNVDKKKVRFAAQLIEVRLGAQLIEVREDDMNAMICSHLKKLFCFE